MSLDGDEASVTLDYLTGAASGFLRHCLLIANATMTLEVPHVSERSVLQRATGRQPFTL